jgi:hypothetical protein
MEQLGIAMTIRVHTTRLKERIMSNFPDMKSFTKGRDVFLTFDDTIAESLTIASERNSDSEAISLSKTAQIIRRSLFAKSTSLQGTFTSRCQEESVPDALLALIRMILKYLSIKTQAHSRSNAAALTLAQLIKFNSVKRRRTDSEVTSVRHKNERETPIPISIGHMLHAETKKRDLVDKLPHLGPCLMTVYTSTFI